MIRKHEMEARIVSMVAQEAKDYTPVFALEEGRQRALILYRAGVSETAAILAGRALMARLGRPPSPRLGHHEPRAPRRGQSGDDIRRIAAAARAIRVHARKVGATAVLRHQAVSRAIEVYKGGNSIAWAIAVGNRVLEDGSGE